jgi:hypothetical protein
LQHLLVAWLFTCIPAKCLRLFLMLATATANDIPYTLHLLRLPAAVYPSSSTISTSAPGHSYSTPTTQPKTATHPPAIAELLPGLAPAAAAAAVLQLMGSTGPINLAMLGSLRVQAYAFSWLRSFHSIPVLQMALLLESLACG